MTLGLGVVGGGVALAALRSLGISAFLRLFVAVFTVEYAVLGAAHLLGKHGFWRKPSMRSAFLRSFR